MRPELENQADRLHLLIHQLQNSVVVAADAGGDDYETIVKTAASALREELDKIDEKGDSAMTLMMVFLMEGVRV